MSRHDEGSGHPRALIPGLFLSSQYLCYNTSTIEALDVMIDYHLAFAWNAPSLRGSWNTTPYKIRTDPRYALPEEITLESEDACWPV